MALPLLGGFWDSIRLWIYPGSRQELGYTPRLGDNERQATFLGHYLDLYIVHPHGRTYVGRIRVCQ